jgi:hypothetical protein
MPEFTRLYKKLVGGEHGTLLLTAIGAGARFLSHPSDERI